MDDVNDDGAPVAPKRKRGRPIGSGKGQPRVPGSGRKKAVPDILGDAARMLPDLLQFHYSIVKGEPQVATGPTGKPYKKLPTLAERQESAAWIAKLADKKQPDPTPEPVASDLDTQQITDLRNAVRTAVGLRKSVLPVDVDAQTVSLIEDGDFTVVDPIDGNTVQSISDLDLIRRHDLGELPPPVTTKNDSRIDFEADFYALRDVQAGSGKVIWRLFNADHQECGIKSTPALAEKWFYENTIPGQRAAKNKAAS